MRLGSLTVKNTNEKNGLSKGKRGGEGGPGRFRKGRIAGTKNERTLLGPVIQKGRRKNGP